MGIETRTRPAIRTWLAGIVVALLVVPFSAFGSLGGDEATVQADRAHTNGTLKVARAQRYAVHEIRAPSGTLVREYVSPSGNVFGVAWNGPTMPDLRQVLGTYFDLYVEAAAKRGARGPVLVRQPGLVVQSSGHMRAFVGIAYVPEALPDDVAAEEIR
jgi:hypothetical protein